MINSDQTIEKPRLDYLFSKGKSGKIRLMVNTGISPEQKAIFQDVLKKVIPIVERRNSKNPMNFQIELLIMDFKAVLIGKIYEDEIKDHVFNCWYLGKMI